MKKFRTIMMTVLAMLMVVFCFASCGKTGKYTATAYTIAGFTKVVEETEEVTEEAVAEVSEETEDKE